MKADQARILTDESLYSRYAKLETHPEYITICDRIRAAAIGNEQDAPSSYLATDIFKEDIIGLLRRDKFEVSVIGKYQDQEKFNCIIRW